jgi:predicted  nucleic acid-binding Zn-ribbon protein
MLSEIEQLLILQDRDRKIRTRRVELTNAPLERKGCEDRLAAAQKSVETAKLKGKEIEVERKKLENDAQTRREQIAKFQTQKFQTRKNEEFQALNHEIERFEKDIQSIEDRELELMESAEKQKAAVAEAEKELAATKAQVARQLADIAAKITALEEQLGALDTERAQIAGGLDEDLRDGYERLFKTKNGEAVVPLEHEVCNGCHMKVTPTTIAKCKAGKEVVHCEQCGRILYRGD